MSKIHIVLICQWPLKLSRQINRLYSMYIYTLYHIVHIMHLVCICAACIIVNCGTYMVHVCLITMSSNSGSDAVLALVLLAYLLPDPRSKQDHSRLVQFIPVSLYFNNNYNYIIAPLLYLVCIIRLSYIIIIHLIMI